MGFGVYCLKHMNKRAAILIITFYSLLSASCVQPVVDVYGGVSGVVKDSRSSETMKDVKVVLSPGGASQITGSDGTFSFEKLEPTEYTLSFKKKGYSDETQKVSVKAGLVSSVHVSMAEVMPILEVTPDVLDFGLNVSTLAIDIVNSGKGILEWEISEGAEWLTCSKTKGVTEEQPTSVVLNVSRDGLKGGNHSETLVVTSNGGSSVIKVMVDVKEVNPPGVSVENADEVTYDSALLNGTVFSVGSSGIIRHGFCYDKAREFDSSPMTRDLGPCSAPYSFQVRITGLIPDTKYYYRSFAENLDGISYSSEILEFKTSSKPTLPEVVTGSVKDISSENASVSSSLTSLGNLDSVKSHGHVWSAGRIPDLNDYDGIDDLKESYVLKEFTSNMTSLTHGTEYYVRAYAVNQIGTSYGDVVRFTTETIQLPVVTTDVLSYIYEECIRVYSSAVGEGISSFGYVYSTSPSPTIENAEVVAADGSPEDFQALISGLKTNTTYYIRAYATNAAGTSYGEELEARTMRYKPRMSSPHVAEGWITCNSTYCQGIVSDARDHILVEAGFCWSEKEYINPEAEGDLMRVSAYWDDNHSDSFDYVFFADIKGLQPDTQYYICAYVKNLEGEIFYSDVTSIRTLEPIDPPVISSGTAETSSDDMIYVYGASASASNGIISDYGFVYSTTHMPTIFDCDLSNVEVIGNADEFKAYIRGLESYTKYYIRAFASNEGGIAYGEELEAVTARTAPVISCSIYGIDKTSATFNCSLSVSNGHIIEEAGFCWSSTNPNPDVFNASSIIGTEIGAAAWQSYVSNLSEDTKYYVRAYVRNSEGAVFYSDVRSFTTLSSPKNHTAGLLAYYTFENTTVNIHGSSYNGTGNNVSYVSGVNGTKALKFATEKSNFTVSSSMIDDDEYSISFWVKGMYDGHIYSVKSFHSTFEYTQILSMYKNQLKYMRWMTYPDYYRSLRGFTHNVIDDSDWHMITFISEKTTNKNILRLSLYIDGELADIINHNYDDGVMNTGVKFIFGGAIDTNGLTDLNGVMMTIDNLRVYSHVLSADDVKQIYEYEK